MRSCQHSILKTNYEDDSFTKNGKAFQPTQGRLSEDNICVLPPPQISKTKSTKDKCQFIGNLSGHLRKISVGFS